MDDDDQYNRHQMTIDGLEAAVKQWDHSLKCDPAYGNVFATSGYRVDETAVDGFSSGCTLDWGAVEVKPMRARSNEVQFTPPAVVSNYMEICLSHTDFPYHSRSHGFRKLHQTSSFSVALPIPSSQRRPIWSPGWYARMGRQKGNHTESSRPIPSPYSICANTMVLSVLSTSSWMRAVP